MLGTLVEEDWMKIWMFETASMTRLQISTFRKLTLQMNIRPKRGLFLSSKDKKENNLIRQDSLQAKVCRLVSSSGLMSWIHSKVSNSITRRVHKTVPNFLTHRRENQKFWENNRILQPSATNNQVTELPPHQFLRNNSNRTNNKFKNSTAIHKDHPKRKWKNMKIRKMFKSILIKIAKSWCRKCNPRKSKYMIPNTDTMKSSKWETSELKMDIFKVGQPGILHRLVLVEARLCSNRILILRSLNNRSGTLLTQIRFKNNPKVNSKPSLLNTPPGSLGNK